MGGCAGCAPTYSSAPVIRAAVERLAKVGSVTYSGEGFRRRVICCDPRTLAASCNSKLIRNLGDLDDSLT